MHRNSIHDIKPSSKLKKSKGYEDRRLEHDPEPEPRVRRQQDVYDDPYVYRHKSGGGKAIWYVAVFCILLLGFALSFFFSSAEVVVTPRVGTIDIDKLVTAYKNPVTAGGLTYELASLSGETSMPMADAEKVYVERKATGTVRIFNNHSQAPQKLLIDTRLESPDGKIYKTKEAVTVPGQKTVDGKLVPGSVDVEAYADIPGEEYNKEESDFVIFGFKGSPKANTFYARTVTPMSGGFKGDTFAPAGDEDGSPGLSDKLRAELLQKARAELPEGFIIYDDVAVLIPEEPEAVGEGSDTRLVQKGKLYAFVFKEENLTRELVKDVVSDFDTNQVSIKDLQDISVEALSLGDADPSGISSISLTVKGDTEIVWEVDEEAIKDALVGIKERRFEPVLREFRSVEKAELSIKPFWKSTLPSDREQIEVINTVTLE